MANNGHIFELEFKSSISEDVYVKKLKVMNGYKGGGNEGDFLLYQYPKLFIFELKSHRGSSIPFSCIRDKQFTGLYEKSFISGCTCGFIFNFRDLEETYFVFIDDVMRFMAEEDRKSIPIVWVRELGIKLESVKKRTRYRYRVDKLLETLQKF